MKKTLSVLLACLLLVTMAFPAFAANDRRPSRKKMINATDNCTAIVVPDDIEEDVDWDSVFAAIKAAVVSRSDAVELSSFRIPFNGAETDPNLLYIRNYLFYEPVLLRMCDRFG